MDLLHSSSLSLIILVLLSLGSFGYGQSSGTEYISLNAPREDRVWTVVNPNGSISVPAGVPGGIYSDLDAAGVFSTPIYYRFNDEETKWVGHTNWTFSREFNVTEDLLSKSRVELVCQGLDTVAEIFINDVSVGGSDNMFVRYIFDIKANLKVGVNTIQVKFQSPVEYAQQQFDKQSANYAVLPRCVPAEYHGECHANHIRKMQASFAWDWGPSYPSSGIWKDIHIEGFSGALIRDSLLFVSTTADKPDETVDTEWEVTVQVYLEVADPYEPGTIEVIVETLNGSVTLQKDLILEEKLEQVNLTVNVSGENVRLWWPNGYGDQPLFPVKVVYTSNNYGETSQKIMRAGFRVVEIVEDPMDEADASKGLTFFFRVNGDPIYAKGSNSIPIHVLPERVTDNMTLWLFESAKDAHMNMIRIWGGGIYESDYLYELADEYGIMIWQDMMFACSMYPTNPEFLDSVRREVDTQVKRLQHHPSIVMWATNNENEAALRGNWYGTLLNYATFAADYIKLYIDTIKTQIDALDPSRQCMPSSPSNGLQHTEEVGWISTNPYSNVYGDVHYYNYLADGWKWTNYPKTRFASEYGFQSWPHPFTMSTVTDETEDWHWNSTLMTHRQHHPLGQLEMRLEIGLHLPLPAVPSARNSYEAMLYMAQITQSMSVKTETESYRRLKGQLFSNGEGHNMGALYWQLNDIWPGASWASVESTGRWKMLHYYARNFFAPVIISPFKNSDGDVEVYVVSDLRQQFEGKLRARLFELDSLEPILDSEWVVPVPPSSATQVLLIPKTSFEHCENSVSICLLYLTMEHDGVPDNFLFLTYPTEHSVIPNPHLKIENITTVESTTASITYAVSLSTETVTPFVFLNVKKNDVHGSFSDNGFTMVSPTQTVYFQSKYPLSLTDFETDLQVISLHDAVNL